MSQPRHDEPGKLSLQLTVTDMPEALAAARRELASILRETADDEPPAVAIRLRQIADLFEAGLREEPNDDAG